MNGDSLTATGDCLLTVKETQITTGITTAIHLLQTQFNLGLCFMQHAASQQQQLRLSAIL